MVSPTGSLSLLVLFLLFFTSHKLFLASSPFVGGLPTVCSKVSPLFALSSSQSTGSNGCLFEEVSWSHGMPDLGAPLASNIIQRVTIRRHINVVLVTPTGFSSFPWQFHEVSMCVSTNFVFHVPNIVHLAHQRVVQYILHQGPSSQTVRYFVNSVSHSEGPLCLPLTDFQMTIDQARTVK